MKNNVSILLCIIPVVIMASNDGFWLDVEEYKRSYVIRVVNNTNNVLICTLDDEIQRAKTLTLAPRSTSQAFHYEEIPILECDNKYDF